MNTGPEETAPNQADIVILKLGSSVLRDESSIPGAVHAIYQHVREGKRVVAVVSAIGNTTDALIQQAHRLTDSEDHPDQEGYAALLSTGEASSVALLGIGLGRAGVPYATVDAARVGLRTRGSLLDAELQSIDVGVIYELFRNHSVVVMPGFVGRDASSRTSLLGRGGSDLTALFLSHQLGASRCILLKDVDGIYSHDPKQSDRTAHRYQTLHFRDALSRCTQVVQEKAICFAAERKISFEVASPNGQNGTQVGPYVSRLTEALKPTRPLRVALLGLGTVGLGVYQRLAATPDAFQIVGVAVRDLNRHRADGVPPALLSDDVEQVAQFDCDVLVELIGGIEPARRLIRTALAAGRSVVSANKALIAEHGHELRRIAKANDCAIYYSAAVGGAVPLLERISTIAPRDILAIEGVLNGTTNFILDRLAEGKDFSVTVKEAQNAGFAEADPSLDLDGTDAAQKLSILAAHGFRQSLDMNQIVRRGIGADDGPCLLSATGKSDAIRLLASCRRHHAVLKASVAPRTLDADHPLAQLRNEENGLVVYLRNGQQLVLTGKGAGRWPTTESVFADLQALRRGQAPCLPPTHLSLAG